MIKADGPMSISDVLAAQRAAYEESPKAEPPTVGDLIEALKEDYPDLQVPADLLLDAVVTSFRRVDTDEQGDDGMVVWKF